MKPFFIFFSLVFSTLSFSQTGIKNDSIHAKIIKMLTPNYKDFEVVKNQVYAVTSTDSLIVFDYKKEKIIKVENHVISVAKNNNQEIVFLNKKNQIVNFKNRSKIQIKIVCEPYKLMLDKKNIPIVITDKGVVYNDKLYEPLNVKYNHVFYRRNSSKDLNKVFLNPDLVFLDSKNRLWLTYDKGEFGEDVLFFDLEKLKFYKDEYLMIDYDYSTNQDRKDNYFVELQKAFPDKIKVSSKDTLYKFPNQLPILNPIRGIVEKEGEFYISQSLIHFFVSSHFTLLYDFDNEGFYKSYDLTQALLEFLPYNNFEPDLYVNEFLGPLHLNKFDNSVYCYSDKGFFKIIESNREYGKKFIFKPWINWSATNKNNLGADINVNKFEFVSENELFFLTSNNGIGYFNGTVVKYFH